MSAPSWDPNWEPVIGLEVHVQLQTRSKLFSGAPIAYGAAPNSQACAVDLGLPGVLPVLNREVARMAVMLGLAIDADIAERCVFARKHYFYPDLPKGYQISQFELPIVEHGKLTITTEDGGERVIGVTRAHLEEDAGKSVHEGFGDSTGIDLNRAGTPLIEVVSEPEIRSPAEAVAYMRKLHSIVRYLEICDGNMQEGSFRCDANVSVRRRGATEFGTRTETKNINSFRFVERAISHEIDRQIDVIESGGTIVQETRLYDPDRDETRSMRTKEEANDYRYFPDPDLLPVVTPASMIDEIRAAMPELPDARRQRFEAEFGLSAYDARVLTTSREMAEYFEAVVNTTGNDHAKLASNWITGALSAALNRDAKELTDSPVSTEALSALLGRIIDNTISGKIAKDVFDLMWQTGDGADAIIEQQGLRQITDSSAIEAMVDEVIAANPEQVEQFRAGKTKVLGFFVGQVMKNSAGKANPGEVNRLIRDKLNG